MKGASQSFQIILRSGRDRKRREERMAVPLQKIDEVDVIVFDLGEAEIAG